MRRFSRALMVEPGAHCRARVVIDDLALPGSAMSVISSKRRATEMACSTISLEDLIPVSGQSVQWRDHGQSAGTGQQFQ